MDFAMLAAGGPVLREHQVIRPVSADADPLLVAHQLKSGVRPRDDADPAAAHPERAAFHAQRPGGVGMLLAGIVEVLPSGIRADFLWVETSRRWSALLAHCNGREYQAAAALRSPHQSDAP